MRVILVHGFNSSPEMNFHPWLRDQLKDRGFDVVAPKLDLVTGEEFDLPHVIEQMKEQIGLLKNDDILLGHSLGALMIMQYLEAVEMVETPRAVLLVAAPWNVKRPELRRLFMADIDADVLMWKARGFAVIHSKDDKMVPIEHGKMLAESLKAKFIETDGDGHYMDEKYPILLDLIVKISETPFAYAPGEALDDDYADDALTKRFGQKMEREEWMT